MQTQLQLFLASQIRISQGLELTRQPLTSGLAFHARALDVVRLPTQGALAGDSVDELFAVPYVFLAPAVLHG